MPWIYIYSKVISIDYSFPGGPRAHLPVRETEEPLLASLGGEDPPEEGMATRSSILVWKIPWTAEPGGLQSVGSQRVRHD